MQVPGGANRNNYANVPLIVSLAARVGADAVWPGWGHASEKPELPQSLAVSTAPPAVTPLLALLPPVFPLVP